VDGGGLDFIIDLPIRERSTDSDAPQHATRCLVLIDVGQFGNISHLAIIPHDKDFAPAWVPYFAQDVGNDAHGPFRPRHVNARDCGVVEMTARSGCAQRALESIDRDAGIMRSQFPRPIPAAPQLEHCSGIKPP
jgi:hypothetical protein